MTKKISNQNVRRFVIALIVCFGLIACISSIILFLGCRYNNYNNCKINALVLFILGLITTLKPSIIFYSFEMFFIFPKKNKDRA